MAFNCLTLCAVLCVCFLWSERRLGRPAKILLHACGENWPRIGFALGLHTWGNGVARFLDWGRFGRRGAHLPTRIGQWSWHTRNSMDALGRCLRHNKGLQFSHCQGLDWFSARRGAATNRPLCLFDIPRGKGLSKGRFASFLPDSSGSQRRLCAVWLISGCLGPAGLMRSPL